MLYNHLFWLAVILFFCSAICINVYIEYHKTIRILPSIIGIVGLFGLIGWSVSLFTLSMAFDWWWLFGVGAASLLITGILSFFTKGKLSLVSGCINIALVPMIWWSGTRFNSIATFEWFYDMKDAVHSFFA